MEHYKVQLMVNKNPVELNPFVEEFLARISFGIVTSLKGVDYVHGVQIYDRNGDIQIKVNEQDVTITEFPVKIIGSTLRGLISSLKGVGVVESIDVNVMVVG